MITKSENKMIAGVIGGIAEKYGADVSLFRLIFVVAVIFTGVFPGVIAYAVAVVMFPKKENVKQDDQY